MRVDWAIGQAVTMGWSPQAFCEALECVLDSDPPIRSTAWVVRKLISADELLQVLQQLREP